MKLYSKFYDKFNREKPLQEYPRPNLVRNNYTNLNGVWKYQIIKNNQKRRKIMLKTTVRISQVERVKDFNQIVSKMDCDIDMGSGRYIIDAKSIMGIFSLDLSKDIKSIIYSDNKQYLEDLKDFIVK